MKNITEKEIKYLTKPLVVLMVAIASFVVVIILGLRQYNDFQSKISELNTNKSGLTQKVSILRNTLIKVSGNSTYADIALPDKSGVIMALSQVKTLAQSASVDVSNIKTGNATSVEGGMMKSIISFDVEGQRDSVFSYLDSLGKSLPVMVLDKVKINETQGLTRASASVSTYSADFPTKISGITSPVSDLNDNDLNLLQELSTYNLPIFSQVEAQENPVRDNPFN